MIIDFHVHTFPAAVQADRTPYLDRDPIFRNLYASPKAKIATTDDLLRHMDASGVDLSVVQGFGWADADLCRRHNDDLLDAAARYPDRLRVFCNLQPSAGVQATGAEVARCLSADVPAAGFGEVRPDDQGYAGRWNLLEPVWAAASVTGAPLLVHASEPVGHMYAGKGHMTPEVLLGLVEAYPEWPLVLAHLGGGLPFYAAMPEVAAALANVWVDTAAWPLLYRPEVFTALTTVFPAERVLFASDWPLQSQARSIERVRALPLAPAVIEGMLGANAARLLGLGRG